MVTVTGPDNRPAVEKALQGAGAHLLPFKIDRKGLSVWSDDLTGSAKDDLPHKE